LFSTRVDFYPQSEHYSTRVRQKTPPHLSALDLGRRRLLGKVGHRAPHPPFEARIEIEAAEDAVEEVLDHPAALGVGQLSQPVHQLHLLVRRPTFRHRPQHRQP
jgi:hypothetical protein